MNLKDEILVGESATLEFKCCPNENAERWLKIVVAFANGKGGRILFGVDNDRTVVGVGSSEAFALMDLLTDKIADSCSPRGQTVERALAGYSKVRNEVLAKALNYMRYIEEWGSGLRRVNQRLTEYGVRPVELEDAGLSTRMTVWRNKKTKPVSREVVNTPPTSSREGVNTPSAHREGVFTPSANNHEGVNALKKKTVCAGRCSNGQFSGVVDKLVPVVYKKVRSTPGARMSDLMTVAEASRATIERVLARLQREGKVEFRGAPKNGGYYCV